MPDGSTSVHPGIFRSDSRYSLRDKLTRPHVTRTKLSRYCSTKDTHYPQIRKAGELTKGISSHAREQQIFFGNDAMCDGLPREWWTHDVTGGCELSTSREVYSILHAGETRYGRQAKMGMGVQLDH